MTVHVIKFQIVSLKIPIIFYQHLKYYYYVIGFSS